jgi:hypothetical protein
MATLRKNEIGVPIEVDTGLDLSAATVTKLLVRKPGEGPVEWADVTVDDTSIVYVTVAGDLDKKGEYRVAAYVEFAGGVERTGATARFTVEERFD